VEGDACAGERVPLVGPRPLPLRDFLAELGQAMGLAAAPVLPVPRWLVRLGAVLGDRLPGSLLDSETLGMLERGNTAPPTAITQLLGHPPRPTAAFIAPAQRAGARTAAQLSWLLPVLRWSMAALWIVTALLSFGLYPVADSYRLLQRVGIPLPAMPLVLYGAALLDLLLGFGILLLRRRHWLWRAQIALVVAYSVLITVFLPEFWLHPFGPVLKNLPLLAALTLLLSLEEE
ncbi:MAG TPA: SDR family oxidoreductase, partial [Azonexus sp.]|nr:SDR family oxidoreductase [Azonexus sp.]